MNRKWTEIVMATLGIVIQVIVFALNKLTRFVGKKTNGYFDNLASILKKLTEILVYAISVVGLIPGLVIREILCTIYELFEINQTTLISNLTRRPVLEPSRTEIMEKMFRSAEARMISKCEENMETRVKIIKNTPQVRI